MYEKAGLIVNRMPDLSRMDSLDTGELTMLACIPDDRTMTLWDMLGKTVWELPADSVIYQGAEKALREFEIL